MGQKINRDQTVIEKLTHEIAQLKRLKFAKRSEQLNPQQASLLDGKPLRRRPSKSGSLSALRCRQSFHAH
jgi:hypothetical protein